MKFFKNRVKTIKYLPKSLKINHFSKIITRMGVWDIHNAVPREFKPLWGQLALKFDGTYIHYACA